MAFDSVGATDRNLALLLAKSQEFQGKRVGGAHSEQPVHQADLPDLF